MRVVGLGFTLCNFGFSVNCRHWLILRRRTFDPQPPLLVHDIVRVCRPTFRIFVEINRAGRDIDLPSIIIFEKGFDAQSRGCRVTHIDRVQAGATRECTKTDRGDRTRYCH
jgi:hypothetical protein